MSKIKIYKWEILLIKKPNVLNIILQINLFKFLIKYFFLCQTLKFIYGKSPLKILLNYEKQHFKILI